MQRVLNTAKSSRDLSVFAKKPEKGKPFSGNMIETVSIPPGEEIDVEDKFLETEGAKALVDCGDLVVGGAEALDARQAEAAAKAAEAEAKRAEQAATDSAAVEAANARAEAAEKALEEGKAEAAAAVEAAHAERDEAIKAKEEAETALAEAGKKTKGGK